MPRYPQTNLAACLLPWTPAYELDVATFERHVGATIEAGHTDLYLMGTAGEGYALGDEQFHKVVRLFAKWTDRPDLRPQVGIISLSMQQIVERIAFCRDQGIGMFQVSLPSWGALTRDECDAFFEGVCGRYPDCQFLHYNLQRAKYILTGSDYRRICDRIPNLVATKNSTADYNRVADLMHHAPDLQHFFLESGFALGCLWGECSLLCSFDLLFPHSTQEFFEAGVRQNLNALFDYHKKFNALGPRLFGHVTTDHIDGAFDKTLAWIKDPNFSNRLLPPYKGLSLEDSNGIRRAYENLDLGLR